jgi:hypothetical protein
MNNGYSTNRGRIRVYSDNFQVYYPWKSCFATALRYIHWLLTIAKQFTCLHLQKQFNACGRINVPSNIISVDEASNWLGSTFKNSGTVIRVNYICLRCHKFSHVYMPDFEKRYKCE